MEDLRGNEEEITTTAEEPQEESTTTTEAIIRKNKSFIRKGKYKIQYNCINR